MALKCTQLITYASELILIFIIFFCYIHLIIFYFVPGFMLDDDGHLLKLLEEKSLKEKAFYEKIFMEEPENQQWHELKKYLPRYYGPVNIISGGEECILVQNYFVLFKFCSVLLYLVFASPCLTKLIS